MNLSEKKIVFVGVARDVEPYIRQVLRNIETYVGRFGDWAIILVENDSRDGTKQILRNWVGIANAQHKGRARLIELDGLGSSHPSRTDRLAVARNRYLNEIAESELNNFDYLAVTDMDDVNVTPFAMDDFVAAIEFLDKHDDAAAGFPNQFPVYYDIWALRKSGWCPEDCWDEVDAVKELIGKDAAEKKYVFDRQIFIDSTREPIEVESAFGGIGIYKLPLTPEARYIGLKPNGSEVCEHVAFHRALRERGKKLFIIPGLLNITSLRHTNSRMAHMTTSIAANGKTVKLLAGKENKFVRLRSLYPLYGERFALLAARYGHRRQGSILDIGADFGAGLILCRFFGCNSDIVCIESRESCFMLLAANALMHRELFGSFRRIRNFTNMPELDDGRIGLIKLDTEDASEILAQNIPYLSEKHPVLWARTDIRSGESLANWKQLLAAFSGIYRYTMLFDKTGVAIAAGGLTDLQDRLEAFLEQQMEQNRLSAGLQTHSPNLVFFPAEAQDLYEDFRPLLRELKST